MLELAGDGEVGAQEGGGKLGDKLLGTVGFGAEPPAQVTVEAGLVASPMGKLVQDGDPVVPGRGEPGRVGHLDAIQGGRVEGPEPSVADVGPGRFDQIPGVAGVVLDAGDPEVRISLRRVGVGPLDLLRVEHGVAAGDWDAPDPTVVVGVTARGRLDEPPEDHPRTALAPTNVAAEIPGLPERVPASVAVAGHCEQEDVDAPVDVAGGSVVRTATGAVTLTDPRSDALFEVGDDAVGDLGVQVGAGHPGDLLSSG